MFVEKPRSVLEGLIGRELSAITFVRDYAQLHFDGPCINAYVSPTTTIAKEELGPESAGYRDAICSLIGVKVSSVSEQQGESLCIEFSDVGRIAISLRDEDKAGPEAAMYQDTSGDQWNVW